MTVKVELLRRTPYGAPGDIVEVEEDVLAAYGPEMMVKSKGIVQTSDIKFGEVQTTDVKPNKK